MPEPRIVSLLPSATEIVSALGFAGNLVGRSHECDFPAGVDALPVLTASKVRLTGSSRDIDDGVRAVVENGLAVYRVDAERLRALQPDLIVTQDQCDVCAVSLKDVEAAVCDWTGLAPTVVSLIPTDLDGVWDDMRRVAEALGDKAAGEKLVEALKVRMHAIAETAAGLSERPTVATIEWIDPLMTGGNWMPELVAMTGGRNLFGAAGEHSPYLEWEALRGADPDVIVVLPCGFGIARAEAEMPALADLPGWQGLKAVRAGRVYVTDGHHYFNRPGPRLVESLEIMAEILHPEAFDFGHEGAGWRRWRADLPE
jgi:iron complex transport system substrate-binding protein